MPNHPVIIRVKKLATLAQVAASGSHTWRERPTHNADPARTPDNQDLRPVTSSAALRSAVEQRLATVTEKTAAKPVRCIEYLVTANHHAFRENGGMVDSAAYFRDAMEWVERKHGAANIVAANIQLDELTPHLVVYVVPLVEVEAKTRNRVVIAGTNPDGSKRRETRIEQRAAGVRLSASHYLDGRAKLSKLQTDFAAQVGKRHGLVRGVEGSRAKHTTVREFYAGLEAVGRPLEAIPASALEPRVVEEGGFLRRAVVETPEEVAERLTAGMRKLYAPTVAAAGGTGVERKKRLGAEATAKAKADQIARVAPLVAVVRDLPPMEFAQLVEHAQGLQRTAQLAAEAARRAAELGRLLARSAASAAGRYARAAIEAIKAVGDHARVAWDGVDAQWREAAKAGRDGAALSEVTVVQTILEHSPHQAAIQANIWPEERAALLAKARESDRALGRPELGDPLPRGPSLNL
ncbi:MobV family relaxase [Xanthomonas cerealis]|uniref:MobV family relaxase n=1 Tax=Xanthomonas cerealis TaxID=3390025 RepID=UPI000A5047B6|nr:MobV family relaxase [Xanthomonas translucens]UKE48504.1 plasmid recombination protein [Xanthomonas translucens pv. cerealis]